MCALRNRSLMELCLPTGDSRPGLMPWRGGEGFPRAAAAAKGDRGRLLPPPQAAAAAPIREGEGVRSFADATGGRRSGGGGAGRGGEAGYTLAACPQMDPFACIEGQQPAPHPRETGSDPRIQTPARSPWNRPGIIAPPPPPPDKAAPSHLPPVPLTLSLRNAGQPVATPPCLPYCCSASSSARASRAVSRT